MAYQFMITQATTNDLDISKLPDLRCKQPYYTNDFPDLWSYAYYCREELTTSIFSNVNRYDSNTMQFVIHYAPLKGDKQLALAQSVTRGIYIKDRYIYGKLNAFTKEQVSLLCFILCKVNLPNDDDPIKQMLNSFVRTGNQQYFYNAFAIWLINKGLDKVVYRGARGCTGVYTSLLAQTSPTYLRSMITHKDLVNYMIEFCNQYGVKPSRVQTNGTKYNLSYYIK